MSNTLGKILKVTSFGESHGSHVGCVLEGLPAGLILNKEKIQAAVNKRKTNQDTFSSARNEEDIVEIISGIYENKTLGSPICILIKNKDAQSNDYEALKNVYRNSHADFTYEKKYGFRDERGGGRSSFRITTPIVAAGEIANQFLQKISSIQVCSFVSQIGTVKMKSLENINLLNIENSEVKCPDENATQQMLQLIEESKQQGDTLGGIIYTKIINMPIGIGEPIFGKLQAQLAQAIMSINTVKGFEYGSGFENATMQGSESNDEFFVDENKDIKTKTNHSGGIQGGISNGMEINFNTAFKPISSIAQKQTVITNKLEKIELEINGRHDVCALPRAIPVVEAYTQIVLADLFLQHKLNNSEIFIKK